jgi:hypothetical protein
MTGEYVRLPQGAGRRLRQRLIRHIVLHLLLGAAVFVGGFLITAWWPLSELDMVFQAHSWTTVLVSTSTIAVAVKACWLPGTVQGDSLRIRDVIRLVRGCRAWWIAALVIAGLATIVLVAACVIVLGGPGRQLPAQHLLPFGIPVASALFASTNYRTLRGQLRAAARAGRRSSATTPPTQEIPPHVANTFRANDFQALERRDAHGSCAQRRR